jgi:hypothetical protein
MRHRWAIQLCLLLFTPIAFAQSEPSTIKVEVASAYVWGEDVSDGAVSSTILDPVTGNAIHNLSHAGLEVSVRAGFERLGSGMAGSLLNFTTTIVNKTRSEAVVSRAGASVDGHKALALSIVPGIKGIRKRDRGNVWEMGKMYCSVNGFLARKNFFPVDNSSEAFTIAADSSLTASFVAKDPRSYSLRCSSKGCYPTGTTRFYVTVNATDYVFVWPGRSMVYCGN